MKNIKLVIFIVILFAIHSCKSASIFQLDKTKEYFKKGKDFEYLLKLEQDHSFFLKLSYKPHSVSECKGIWKYRSSKIIELECEEEETINKLTNIYMPQREHQIYILSSKKIKYKNQVLRPK